MAKLSIANLSKSIPAHRASPSENDRSTLGVQQMMKMINIAINIFIT